MLEPKNLLQIAELSELQSEVSLKLIDCSIEAGEAIPTAEFLNWQGKPNRVLGCVESLNITSDCFVVCYCSFGIEEAAQVWWILKQLEFPNVSVLNGGLRAWREAKLRVTKTLHVKAEPARLLLPETDGFLKEAPEHFVLLDSDESSVLVKSLLTDSIQLKPTSQLSLLLSGFSERSVAVTGEMAGTALLSLFITGHSDLAWQFKSPVPRPSYRSSSDRASTGSDFFEVVELNRETLNTSFNEKVPFLRDGQSSSSCSCNLI